MARRKVADLRAGRRRPATAIDGGTERLLASYGVPPARAGNRIELVTSGTDAYRRILRMIERGQSTIHITTYILGRDDGSRALLERLTERAAARVSRSDCCSTTWVPGGSAGATCGR